MMEVSSIRYYSMLPFTYTLLITGKAPLLLPIFALLPKSSSNPIVTMLLYSLVDILNANALIDITNSGESISARLFTSPRKGVKWDDISIAAGYLFNPFTIATCLSRSTNVFTNCAILYAISNAVTGNAVNAMLALAFASYLSLYPLLLLPPLILLCYDRHIKAGKQSTTVLTFSTTHSAVWAGSIAALLYASYFITGNSWEFLSATYGFQLLVPDLTPNSGLWWYFFIEIFDSFREFFLGVFWLHLVGYVGGLTFRIRRQPLFVITSLLGLFAIFKPYPSISDVSLYLALIPLYRHIFPRKYLFCPF
jgi:GPI-anchor transamidase subunit U